jgi:hypothetical protein
MASSRRRKWGLVFAGGLLGLGALCLLKIESKPGTLRSAYDRMQIGMPAAEVAAILSESWRHVPAFQSQHRAGLLAGMRPRSVWPMTQEQGGSVKRSTSATTPTFEYLASDTHRVGCQVFDGNSRS